MKFLIDECLSPKLTALAREKGYGESSHIVWLGRASAMDWDLIHLIIDGDWTFVTRNAVDFRGEASYPGKKGQYARVNLHTGLICLNGPDGMTREVQLELFEQALIELDARPDLVNQVLEISLEDDGHLRVVRYALPAEE